MFMVRSNGTPGLGMPFYTMVIRKRVRLDTERSLTVKHGIDGQQTESASLAFRVDFSGSVTPPYSRVPPPPAVSYNCK